MTEEENKQMEAVRKALRRNARAAAPTESDPGNEQESSSVREQGEESASGRERREAPASVRERRRESASSARERRREREEFVSQHRRNLNTARAERKQDGDTVVPGTSDRRKQDGDTVVPETSDRRKQDGDAVVPGTSDRRKQSRSRRPRGRHGSQQRSAGRFVLPVVFAIAVILLAAGIALNVRRGTISGPVDLWKQVISGEFFGIHGSGDSDTDASEDNGPAASGGNEAADAGSGSEEVSETVEETTAYAGELPDIDINSWEYLLVNADNPIGEYEPEVTDCGRVKVDVRIADAMTAFVEAAEAQGLPVYLSSAYRSYDRQSVLYQKKISQGYSEEEAATIVAPPGTSEHQTGLAADITDVYREIKNESLEETETYKWMSAHCQEYGFVVRYPEDKQDITGIIYEPWHFRYVGVEAATFMMNNNLCLEEFVALYK